jgi:metallo-beta-lactamase family protein
MDGAQEVNILGDAHKVKANIKQMDYFSAHADQKGLLDYLKFSPNNKLKNIFLVHGEAEQALPLKEKIESMGYPSVNYPKKGDVFEF